jgi:uncharacterized membrane protein YgcG
MIRMPLKVFFLLLLFLGGLQFFKRTTQREPLIVDNALVLSSYEVKEINKSLTEFDTRSPNQVIVYTISKTLLTDFARFTEELLGRINFGEKGFDKSIVIVIFPNEGHIYLRWGKVINDKIKSINTTQLIDSMKNSFMQNNFSAGIKYGIYELEDVLRK